MTLRSVVRLGFLGLAALCAVFALASVLSSARFLRAASSVEGTVVDVDVRQNAIGLLQSDGTGLQHYPVIEYRSDDRIARTITGRSARGSDAFTVGDTVVLRVLDADPSVARIDSAFEIWGGAIILGGLALGFLATGVLAPLGYGGTSRDGVRRGGVPRDGGR